MHGRRALYLQMGEQGSEGERGVEGRAADTSRAQGEHGDPGTSNVLALTSIYCVIYSV